MRVPQWSAPAKPRRVIPAKPTIAELTEILDSEEGWNEIEILPNGEIRAKGGSPTDVKPLTMREDLGGEYAA
jgi:phage I-like protein